jgi:large subunit ribosomal protein L5
MPTLKDKYKQEMLPALKEELGLANPMRLPRLVKVVVNMGLGGADKDTIAGAAADLTTISGQKAVLTQARKSISNFKLREGMTVGAKVTLRGDRMYEFLDRLINVALPRIRDFRGLSSAGFDGRGNFSLGIREQTIFPEIDPDSVSVTQGMNITVVTTAKTDDEARALLRLMGMPFAKN